MNILLVEDDPAIRSLIEKVLRPQHTIEVVEDGRAALALVEQFDYDLLLLDIDLPQIDGISVCKQLRTQGYQLPVLLLTAKDRLSDRVLGLDAGADDYMVKPFHVPELLARVRALLRRGSTTVASTIVWGDLQLNSVTSEIRYKEQLLHLTPKEYGILELLLQHPQQIFSRSAFIDRLWELEETPTESAISSHIKAIRQKLKAAGATQDLIETMYGFGYRLRSVSPPQQELPKAIAPSLEAPVAFSQEANVSQAAADAVMAELWERFKDSFSLQIDVLDQAVAALRDGHLTTTVQQEAKQTVHKLVGSLGVYGFTQGSILARQIEVLLHPDLALGAAEIAQMAEWISGLRQEIGQPSHLTVSSVDPTPQRPWVLVVDDDETLTARLEAEAMVRSLHLTTAPNPVAAGSMLEHHQPDVILLDLTFSDSHENGLSWLKTLKQRYPQIPILVFTGRDNLTDRITASRLGAQAFLQKPITAAQIFQAVQAALTPQSSLTGKVLVVDDDPIILHRLSIVLSPWGLEVITLLDPNRFWEVLTRTAPDLLILDIEMPDFNGIDLCQVVRQDAQWGNLPILFLTAHQESDMIVQAFAVGGDDYIRKPILEPELVARVLNRLEAGQGRWHRRTTGE